VAPRDGLVERLTDTFRLVGEEATLQVAPGLAPCLARLRDAGVRLGIVCDVGLTSSPTLRDRLEQLGVLEAFDAWAFSDETGWFKPAAAAFRPALDGLRVDPGDAAHVGDNERTDIAGALALGMRAVRFVGLLRWSGLLDEGPATSSLGVPVIEDLEELPALLEVP
jgi:putative hydrolase of the HAD superfamily